MSCIDSHLRAQLLRTARDAIAADLFGAPAAPPREPELPWPPAAGVFVTLRKGEQLRGCIGTFEPGADFGHTLRSIAVSAAHDPRFVERPISAGELRELRIEVSVLSPLRRIANPLEFELGRDGIYVRRGHRAGCFLPDVAVERGWSHETFLSECCAQKAGLDPLAWQDPETEVLVFQVEKVKE
ncbi:MAG: AmmeMemoRadiSam system protein A [Planctomycetota bacterium]|nr:MAG: AmmeMemoRadiSam system protein A [Planctomycetota bacterium]